MYYIIDANNLAGKLGILNEDDFDKALITMIKAWPGSFKNRVELIFDSLDPLGDRYTEDLLTIVYTPRDDYYRSADDKIVERAKILSGSEKDEVTLVTDDAGIKKRVEDLTRDKKITVKSAANFARKLESAVNTEDYQKGNDGSRGLDTRDIDKINDELRKLWE